MLKTVHKQRLSNLCNSECDSRLAKIISVLHESKKQFEYSNDYNITPILFDYTIILQLKKEFIYSVDKIVNNEICNLTDNVLSEPNVTTVLSENSIEVKISVITGNLEVTCK